MPHLEVRRSHPCQKSAGASIQVSSQCYQCTFVQWQQVNSRGFGSSFLCRPHQTSNREIRLKGSRCGESPCFGSLADIYDDRVLTQISLSIPRETVIIKLVDTCQKVAMLIYWIVPNWHFSNTLTTVFPCFFSSVVRRMPGYNTQRRGTVCTVLRHCNFTWVPDFRRESNTRHNQSGFEPHKAFQAKLYPLIKTYCLLSNGPQFVQVYKREGKRAGVSTLPTYSLRCLSLRPAMQ